MQYYKGVEHNANAIYTNLQNKYYDNDKGYFMKTNYESAERWARSGRFAITVKYNTAGSGHIATLIGGYKKDNSSWKNALIFQAGGFTKEGRNAFGMMTIEKGFRTSNEERKPQFWIWREK